MEFKVGDHVYASDWGEGIIVSIDQERQEALVDMDTGNFGGVWGFELEELKHVEKRIATLKAFKSVHGTVNVVIQNCSIEATTWMHRFDVWGAWGNYKYNEQKPDENPEIWFECPMEFIDFVESSMGREAFRRMGVEEFDIKC